MLRIKAIIQILLGHDFMLILLPDYGKSRQIYSYQEDKHQKLLDNFSEIEKDIKNKIKEKCLNAIIDEISDL